MPPIFTLPWCATAASPKPVRERLCLSGSREPKQRRGSASAQDDESAYVKAEPYRTGRGKAAGARKDQSFGRSSERGAAIRDGALSILNRARFALQSFQISLSGDETEAGPLVCA